MTRWLALFILLSTAITTNAVVPEFTVRDGAVHLKNVGPDNPVIYDNDWWTDVFDAYYLWARTSLGEANLRGNIVTRDMWEHPDYLYTMKRCMDDARKAISLARDSGYREIPDPTPGADRVLAVPESRRMEDTVSTPSEGSRLLIAEARKASPQQPLLVFCGGPLTTVANALLEAPDIASRIIVFSLSTHAYAYNGKDGWSAYVVAKQAPLVEWAPGSFWDKNSVLRPEHFEALPDTPINHEMKRFIQTDLGAANQMGDGAAIVWQSRPSCWQAAIPMEARYEGNAVRYSSDGESPELLTIPKAASDLEAMRSEFFRVITDERLYK